MTCAQKEFALVAVIEFNRKYLKLTKFIYLCPSIRAIFPGSEGKVWKFRKGNGVNIGGQFLANFGKSRGKERGHAANPFCGGGMDIFWNHICQLPGI